MLLTLSQMIDVMESAMAGAEIESAPIIFSQDDERVAGEWRVDNEPDWDWDCNVFRVKVDQYTAKVLNLEGRVNAIEHNGIDRRLQAVEERIEMLHTRVNATDRRHDKLVADASAQLEGQDQRVTDLHEVIRVLTDKIEELVVHRKTLHYRCPICDATFQGEGNDYPACSQACGVVWRESQMRRSGI